MTTTRDPIAALIDNLVGFEREAPVNADVVPDDPDQPPVKFHGPNAERERRKYVEAIEETGNEAPATEVVEPSDGPLDEPAEDWRIAEDEDTDDPHPVRRTGDDEVEYEVINPEEFLNFAPTEAVTALNPARVDWTRFLSEAECELLDRSVDSANTAVFV